MARRCCAYVGVEFARAPRRLFEASLEGRPRGPNGGYGGLLAVLYDNRVIYLMENITKVLLSANFYEINQQITLDRTLLSFLDFISSSGASRGSAAHSGYFAAIT